MQNGFFSCPKHANGPKGRDNINSFMSWVGFNVHLESLSEEAFENAAVEIKGQAMGGMGGMG